MSEKKKKIIISTCLILVLILAVVGISYAAFQFVGQGQQVNQITTGTIQMNYEEGSNVIRLNNALPTTDETGMKRLTDGEYFDFSVTTNITGDALINWEIASEDFEDNTFDGENVKFYLTKLVDGNEEEVSSSLPAVYNEKTSENKKTGRPANMMSLLTGSTSTEGEEVTNYRLRLYVDEKYNPQGDGGGLIFKTRINVYGKVSTEIEPIMKKAEIHYASDSTGGGYVPTNDNHYYSYPYRYKITSIVTKDNVLIPDTAIEYWDESEADNGSVITYVEDDGSGNGTYKITIGGTGKIVANEDSNYLFAGLNNLASIDLSYLDTSEATSMVSMFDTCLNLTKLDLSKFNTSKVITMKNMFAGCEKLESVDLSSFDTSNVTDMSCMFGHSWSSDAHSGCATLVSLDLSSFDTSKVTDMHEMFEGCSSLSTLDLSNFDTSKTENMNYIFAFCSNLSNIIVSDKWTTENVSPTNMFYNCGTDHVTVI